MEQALTSLVRGAQLAPEIAVDIGDARRFVACAHEEARHQLAVLLTASAHTTAFNEDLREAVSLVARQQAAHAGASAARLRAVLDALTPLKVAASVLAFTLERRAPKTAILHLAWIERWLLFCSAPMKRAIALTDARGSGDGPAAAQDAADPRSPEPITGDRPAMPSRRTTRPQPASGRLR